jgi:hypothetical protein
MANRNRTGLMVVALLGLVVLFSLIKSDAKLPAETPTSTPLVTDVVKLTETQVTESSGLAASQRKPNRFWTHNDSGGQPLLFAFDNQGRSTGRLELKGIGADDWEDMASFVDGERPRLLVADCGDNQRRRSSITLYLMDEPDPDAVDTVDARLLEIITVAYPDGPQDCEAVAVDPQRRQILLIAKSFLPAVGVYSVPLPERAGGDHGGRHQANATRIATLHVPLVTAMDVNQQNGDVWVAGYFQAFCFRCQDRQGAVADQFAKLPQSIELPRWRQIEAFAVDPAEQIWLTSEGSPMLFGRIPIQPLDR